MTKELLRQPQMPASSLGDHLKSMEDNSHTQTGAYWGETPGWVSADHTLYSTLCFKGMRTSSNNSLPDRSGGSPSHVGRVCKDADVLGGVGEHTN